LKKIAYASESKREQPASLLEVIPILSESRLKSMAVSRPSRNRDGMCRPLIRQFFQNKKINSVSKTKNPAVKAGFQYQIQNGSSPKD
jgi:hypothetical protein